MTDHSLLMMVLLLILLSCFFSGSETAIMSLNHFRLHHLKRKDNPKAARLLKLVERPDRLLGVILFGNTTTNIVASSLATAWALQVFGDKGPLLASFILSFVVLVFAEMTPKTLAAMNPERFAFRVSWIMKALLQLFYPVVWMLSGVSSGILALFRVKVEKKELPRLSRDELRSIVMMVGGHEQLDYQAMLLRLIDSETVTVEDIMVPMSDIVAVNLDDDAATILSLLKASSLRYLPLYQGQLNHVVGLVDLGRFFQQWDKQNFTVDYLLKQSEPAYFIPEGASIITQASQFRDMARHTGFVVDEYGDLQGLVTLDDVIEEIVGEFSDSLQDTLKMIRPQEDGSITVDASLSLRVLNRELSCRLKSNGAKTLSGLIVEVLDGLPQAPLCLSLQGMQIEVLSFSDHCIKEVRILKK